MAGTFLACGAALLAFAPPPFHKAPPSIPSVVGTWGSGPLVTKWDRASIFPVGKPSVQLVLNADGTGRYVFSNVGQIPLTWTVIGSGIVLNEPRGYPEKGVVSPDGRFLTITYVMKIRNFQNSWRFLFLGEKPATQTTRWRRL